VKALHAKIGELTLEVDFLVVRSAKPATSLITGLLTLSA
jgi:hypothetical protein